MDKRLVAAAIVIAATLGDPRGGSVYALTSQIDPSQQDDVLSTVGTGGTTRLLQEDLACNTDDARDLLRPRPRATRTYRARRDLAKVERDATLSVCQVNNGDTDLASKFHKTLPHNELGQVDESAFQALLDCILAGDYETCEAVPAGESTGVLVDPIGGNAFDMAGPVSSSMAAPPVPTLGSRQLAAQLAESYWMALARDVPFSKYSSSDVTIAAAANLAQMRGFAESNGVAMGADGSIDPSSMLFRANFVGLETGPMISQLLVMDYTVDSTTITPKITTYVPGVDYMTSYDEWLFIQNGGLPDSPEETDRKKRYIRNARDLSRMVYTDTITSEAFRGAMILIKEEAISYDGFNGLYASSQRQRGFVIYGLSHIMKILGSAAGATASAWYQKWKVHQFARPEALGGLVHNLLTGALDGPQIHKSLLKNDELLDRIAAANAAQNEDGTATYLLPQAVKEGSPAHPSYPSGHATQNGAFATVLKALVGYERGMECFSDPVYPDDDGLELLPYEGEDCLTYEGEINKLAANVAFGRQMLGVHYRFDATEGLLLGQTIGVRTLHQELMTIPTGHVYKFRLLQGEVIELYPDGSFAIDGENCKGDVFTGVGDC